MFAKEIYTARRNKLKTDVGSGIIVLPGNDEVGMNYRDNIYHFRQDSTFLYFTGIDLPNLVFVIDIDNNTESLFGDDLTVDQIVWTGPVAPLSVYTAKSGIDNLQSFSSVETVLKKAVQQKRQVHFLNPYRGEIIVRMSEWLSMSYREIQNNVSLVLTRAIIAQRSYKSSEEVAEINKAVDATAAMQIRAAQLSQQGTAEYEIAGEIEGVAVSSGGRLSFPVILTVNGQYLHNHAGHNKLKNGQMLLVDCGAETAMHYAGDMTRTFPVDKKFTAQQREIYDIVLDAQQSAITALHPGKLFKEVHLLACEKLAEGLKQIGLMKGDAKEAVAAGAHTLFFQCGLGHMMGLDVHDMENLGEEYVGYTDTLKKSKEFGLKSLRLGKALEENFVITVEPGIYIIPELIDQWQAIRKHSDFINYEKVNTYRSFGGIRIEEDFLITPSGCQLLGKPLGKTANEAESLKISE
ncbi:MAG: aminopeptidase P family protein [Chitinophagaceae bacterium]|nr:aminopeptidase P family protein [Chitinophagaceae bacterium]